MNKQTRVLNYLRNFPETGVSNGELATISLRYGAIIHKLRNKGHKIRTECINHDTGNYRYYYEGTE